MNKIDNLELIEESFDMLSYIRVWLYNDPIKSEMPKAVIDMYYYSIQFNNCLIRSLEDFSFVHSAYIDIIRLVNKHLENFKEDYRGGDYFISKYEQRLFIAMEEAINICKKEESKLWWFERNRLLNVCEVIAVYMPLIMMPRSSYNVN